MTPDELMRLGPRLVEFTEQMLQGAARRSDQRAKGQLYVRGLLTDGARKSMQPMAARLGVDHQALQQFISSSLSRRLPKHGMGILDVLQQLFTTGPWLPPDPAATSR